MARKRIKSTICKNCDTKINIGDHFCHECGQENHAPNQPIKHLFFEFIESIFHFDTKILFTYKTFFSSPGKITKEYNENKRMRYVPPMRMYIFTSAIFFFFLQMSTESNTPTIKTDAIQQNRFDSILENNTIINKNDTSFIKPDSTINVNFSIFNQRFSLTPSILDEISKNPEPVIDSLIISKGLTPNFFYRKFFKQMIKTIKADDQYTKNILRLFIKNTSISIFVLMPIFGLLLFLIYYKFKKNYYEYLILSIHYHTIFFTVLGVIIVIGYWFKWNSIVQYGVFIMWIYLLFTLKYLFEQGWIKTIAKTILCSLMYTIILFIGLFISLLLGWIYI
ncbi:MAG TPA: DUF3667 domain-containing protein [Saprospiraceae bacterium]|nr:DUF3667 domain-containing protein [Saprospiraceae bacterium]